MLLVVSGLATRNQPQVKTARAKRGRGIRLPGSNLIQRSWVTGREVVEDAQPCTCSFMQLLTSCPILCFAVSG